MQLPKARVGSYLGALRAALDALAPDSDHVPLSACQAHLQALEPSVSGGLLLPAEVSQRTGMPAYTWLERARAEQIVARQGMNRTDPDDVEIARVTHLDKELGTRMRDRRDLHRHLRAVELLPATRIRGEVVRMSPTVDIRLIYDRMAPDGRWMRIRLELLDAPKTGALTILQNARISVHESVQHLLTRHFAVSLPALRSQAEDALGAHISRISRSWIGPFWYPGVILPEGVPEDLGKGLLLHLSTEVIAAELTGVTNRDPLWSQPEHLLPEGHGYFAERRFAAMGQLSRLVSDWAAEQQIRAIVMPIARRPARRKL